MVKISIIKGDITEQKVDAIVNAANKSLLGGGGVDGAIHRKAGQGLLEECKKIRKEKYPNGLPKGEAVATKAYNLDNVKIIIHTVGPIYEKEDIDLLKNCYINSLKIAETNKIKSIAFPAISTGVYGVPIELSAKIVKQVLDDYKSGVIEKVLLVLFDEGDYEVYKRVFNS